MYAIAHSWKCQIEFGRQYQRVCGMTSGEETEQTDSYTSPAGFINKTMTKTDGEEELTQLA